MSLTKMIVAHDDATLTALANKGLLRRAMRDIDAGLVQVETRSEDAATVIADGQIITLTNANPIPSDCPCSATGFCRHLLGAMIVLRGTGADVKTAPTTAADDIMALTDDEIARFAGVDVQAALALSTGDIQISQQGTMIEATISGMASPVQIIAGHPLRDAVFKGPASRKRMATAAAVFALRAARGKAFQLDGTRPPQAQTKHLSEPFLTEVETALERLLAATLAGAAQLHMDHVFDLSISARSQAAPRLTGALRGITAMAGLTINRDVSFDPERFAVTVAQTYALVQALKSVPDDPVLMGVLQRDYVPADPLHAMALGARAWQTASGARGLSVYLYDTDNNRWVSSERGRAGGADPSFTPDGAYRLPLLGAASVPELMGYSVAITAPHLSADLQLSPSTSGLREARLTLKDLQTHPAMFKNWAAARADLAGRGGTGLRDAHRPLPILLHPTRIQRQGFDDFEQLFKIQMLDTFGDGLTLTLPAKDKDIARWLEEAGGKLRGLICVTQPDGEADTLTPVAAMLDDHGKVGIANLTLDPLPSRKSLMATLGRKFAGEMATIQSPQSAITRLSVDIIRDLSDHLSGADLDLSRHIRQSEALGLGLLHRLLDGASEAPGTRTILKLIYVADRVAV